MENQFFRRYEPNGLNIYGLSNGNTITEYYIDTQGHYTSLREVEGTEKKNLLNWLDMIRSGTEFQKEEGFISQKKLEKITLELEKNL